jgi:hypothetical protein
VTARARCSILFGPDDAACAELRAELLSLSEEAKARAALFALEGRFVAAETCLGFAHRVEAALSETQDGTG